MYFGQRVSTRLVIPSLAMGMLIWMARDRDYIGITLAVILLICYGIASTFLLIEELKLRRPGETLLQTQARLRTSPQPLFDGRCRGALFHQVPPGLRFGHCEAELHSIWLMLACGHQASVWLENEPRVGESVYCNGHGRLGPLRPTTVVAVADYETDECPDVAVSGWGAQAFLP